MTYANNPFTQSCKGVFIPRESLVKKATVEKAMRKAEGNFYIIVGSANNLASSAISDALFYLKKRNFYNCREGRKWAVQADKKYREYETAMKFHLKEFSANCRSGDGRDKYNLWLDTTDKVEEIIHPHIFRLFQVIKRVFDRYHIEESEALAYIWTAHIMTDTAVAAFDKLFNTIKDEFGIDISPLFVRGRISDVFTCWRKATDAYIHQLDTSKTVIDFYKEPDILLGVDVILTQLSDMELYNQAGDYGIGQNLDVVEKGIREEYEESKRKEVNNGK